MTLRQVCLDIFQHILNQQDFTAALPGDTIITSKEQYLCRICHVQEYRTMPVCLVLRKTQENGNHSTK
jgi:hypothetical protein